MPNVPTLQDATSDNARASESNQVISETAPLTQNQTTVIVTPPSSDNRPSTYLSRRFSGHLERFEAFQNDTTFHLGVVRYVSGVLLEEIFKKLRLKAGQRGKTTVCDIHSNNHHVSIGVDDVFAWFGEKKSAYARVHAEIKILRRVWEWVRMDLERLTPQQALEDLPLLVALLGNGKDLRKVRSGATERIEVTPLSLIHSANAEEILRRHAAGTLDDPTARLLRKNVADLFQTLGRRLHADISSRYGLQVQE